MNEILKKIDELKTKKHQGYLHNGIEQSRYLGMLDMANEIIKILSEQSSQKEPCKNCIGPGLAVSRGITDMRIDKSDIPRQITVGDKIRESNESLAEFIDSIVSVCSTRNVCDKCPLNEVCGDGVETIKLLNQPSTGTP
jgi:hypothetical protein